ncbi:YhgE/Pip domain-containing protein [Planotetraspora sp. A-T 1434]|uniref:YhgE/Pip family protein n=1 Tax=Planotetraspora sp. A-T 1434 TaxID=2979219 RepID=UPI0021C0CDDE|nr:YhgE/Pip domain-containing protein [Planotetraspora sp. A-T 1434]MCT9928927.1 YhgE/Pip domain-containing protein [Planotetraspora sp. A-T 1434]
MSRPLPLHLGRLELRRFMRSRLTRAALVGVIMLPLLYAGLYLWSLWDPQGHLDNVPVALVVEDQPATVDGKTVDAGRDLAAKLKERDVFDWHTVDAAEAGKGVEDGKYYLSLTIPRDFSANLASPSGEASPTPAELGVRVDTGRSYIMRTISDAVFKEVKEAADRSAVHDYLNQIFLSFGDLHDQTVKAAEGADRIHDGTRSASEGASSLQDGLGTAKGATSKLSAGAGTLYNGSETLANGLDSAYRGSTALTSGLSKAASGAADLRRGLAALDRGAGKLAEGNRQAYEQVHALSPTINQAAGKYVPVLTQNGERIRSAALALAEGADAFAGALGDLPREVQGSAGETRQDLRAVERWLNSHPDADPELRALVERASGSAGNLAEAAARLENRIGSQSGRIDDLARQARAVADDARELAAAAPALGAKLDQARDKFNQLDHGLKRLSDGAAELRDGTGKALNGASSLSGGLRRLSDGAGTLSNGLRRLDNGAGRLNAGLGSLASGAGQLNTGIAKLYTGAGKLDSGLVKLADGSGELADKLGDGAAQIPDYGKAERDSRTDMMSEPVRLDTEVDNAVPNYGTGFAPFFVPLALWVGAMVTYMLLRPMNPRLVAGSAPAWRTALAGWLPALTMGALQVAVLLAVLRFGLGLSAEHWLGVAAFLVLTAAAFLAIVQAVNALLGPPGRVVVLALLMLQLTSSAGTYPIETSPRFFQAISPWLPMSWVVSAMRRLISGGDLTVVWQACGVLSAFVALGLALTVFAVHKGRTWSMRRLKPELAL